MSQRNPIVIEDSDSDDNNPIGVSTRQNCHNEAPEPHRPDPDKKKKKRWKPVPAVEDSDNHIESIHARKRPQLRPRQGMMSLPLAQRRSLHLGSISSSSSDSQDLINTSHSKSYSDHPPLSGDPVAMHLRRPDYRARQYGNTVQLMSKAERQEFLSRKHYESLKNQVPQYGRNTGVSNQGRGERREEAYTGTATMSATMSATAEPGSTIIHAPARLPPFSSHQQLPLSPTTLTHAPHEAANLLWQRHCNSTARPQLINVNKEHKVGDEFSTDSAHEESVKNKTLATHKAPLERVEEEEEYKTGAVDESHAVSYVNAEKSVDLTWLV